MLWPIPLGASPSGYSVDWARPSVLPQKRQQQLPKDSANVLSYAPWGAHPGSRASAAETRAETDEGARADELSIGLAGNGILHGLGWALGLSLRCLTSQPFWEGTDSQRAEPATLHYPVDAPHSTVASASLPPAEALAR